MNVLSDFIIELDATLAAQKKKVAVH